MSVFNIKSTAIAQRDNTSVRQMIDPIQNQGLIRESFGVEKTGNAIMDAASVMKLCIVPSGARISTLEYMAQSLGTSALDIAVWYPTFVPPGGGLAASLAGTLISSSAFAANIAGVDTTITPTDGLGTLAQFAIDKRSKPLWQVLGLASDPNLDLDMGFSVRTATSVQGYVGLRARYVR